MTPPTHDAYTGQDRQQPGSPYYLVLAAFILMLLVLLTSGGGLRGAGYR